MAVPLERNQDATLYVGGLDEKVNEAILWELMVQVKLKFILLSLKKSSIQAGPVTSVNMPKDRVTGNHQG